VENDFSIKLLSLIKDYFPRSIKQNQYTRFNCQLSTKVSRLLEVYKVGIAAPILTPDNNVALQRKFIYH